MAKDKPIISLFESYRKAQPAEELLPLDDEQADHISGGPQVLERIPAEIAVVKPSARIVSLTDPHSPGADRMRYLAMRLRSLKTSNKLRTVLITSPLPGDGKSTISLNLATTLAEGGKKAVLLIEGDLHRPKIAATLGLQPRPGLSESLETGADPFPTLRYVDALQCYLLQAGKPQVNATDLILSSTLPDIFDRLIPHFDWILVDSPPVAPLSDATILSRLLDATLLVVRADRTPRDAVEEAVNNLGTERIAGIVFNAAEELNSLYSKYAFYYSKR